MITFHVDFASTPKKGLPRSSTPMGRKTTTDHKKKESNRKHIQVLNCCKKNLLIEKIKTMRKELKLRSTYESNTYVNPLYFDHSQSSYQTSQDVLVESSWDKLKYPVCFLPNQKTQDMDRMNTGSELFGPSVFTYTLI